MTVRRTLSPASTAFRQGVRLEHIAFRALRDGKATYSRRRIAREALSLALADLVAHEDRCGVEYVAWVADIVTRARQLAQRAELLSPEDVSAIESRVVNP